MTQEQGCIKGGPSVEGISPSSLFSYPPVLVLYTKKSYTSKNFSVLYFFYLYLLSSTSKSTLP